MAESSFLAVAFICFGRNSSGNAICFERLRLVGFASHKVSLFLTYEYDADFVDIFPARGSKREKRGQQQEPKVSPASVQLAYCGLDKVIRETRLNFYPQPARISGKSVGVF